MDDDDDAADQHTAAAADPGATVVAPPPAGAGAELAWSLLADGETVPAQRHSWALVWTQAAAFVSMGVASAVVVAAAGWLLLRARHDPPQSPPVARRPAQVTATTSTKAPPAPSTVTVVAAAPTVTVEATPPTVTVEAPATTASRVAAPHAGEADDERFLEQMRSLGYVIVNPQVALGNAHEACRLLRRGESTDQVDQEMSARTGANMTDTLQLVSSAMLVYPDCY